MRKRLVNGLPLTVALNQAQVSFGGAETTLRVIERVQHEGVCWCGGTTWQGHVAMRISARE
jgi:hypothetical protein